jgi:hypothetical protein
LNDIFQNYYCGLERKDKGFLVYDLSYKSIRLIRTFSIIFIANVLGFKNYYKDVTLEMTIAGLVSLFLFSGIPNTVLRDRQVFMHSLNFFMITLLGMTALLISYFVKTELGVFVSSIVLLNGYMPWRLRLNKALSSLLAEFCLQNVIFICAFIWHSQLLYFLSFVIYLISNLRELSGLRFNLINLAFKSNSRGYYIIDIMNGISSNVFHLLGKNLADDVFFFFSVALKTWATVNTLLYSYVRTFLKGSTKVMIKYKSKFFVYGGIFTIIVWGLFISYFSRMEFILVPLCHLILLALRVKKEEIMWPNVRVKLEFFSSIIAMVVSAQLYTLFKVDSVFVVILIVSFELLKTALFLLIHREK